MSETDNTAKDSISFRVLDTEGTRLWISKSQMGFLVQIGEGREARGFVMAPWQADQLRDYLIEHAQDMRDSRL